MTCDDAAAESCPECGGAPTPIVYGYPSYETFEAADRGEVVLGGCLVWDGQPTRQCSDCGAAFGSRGPRGKREQG